MSIYKKPMGSSPQMVWVRSESLINHRILDSLVRDLSSPKICQNRHRNTSKIQNIIIDSFSTFSRLGLDHVKGATMNIGYARVSTQDQNLDMQIDALTRAGCEKIYEEKASGGKADRPELARMLEHLRSGDILVIWKLDRLGRSLRHLIDLIEKLKIMGVELVSIQDNVNTDTPTGKLTFAVFGALAEFERDIIRERTNAGLVAARARGRVGGRKKALSENQVKILMTMAGDKSLPIGDICRHLKISKATYYNYMRQGSKQ